MTKKELLRETKTFTNNEEEKVEETDTEGGEEEEENDDITEAELVKTINKMIGSRT